MSGPIISPTRPRRRREDVVRQLLAAGVVDRVALVGCRGYYRRSVEENQRGVYDDAIFLITPETFAAFNANVDPSIFRTHIATLRKGLWKYKLGTHGLNKPAAQRYTALVQAEKVTVDRDGEKSETGWFGINIHRGGVNGTSSLGCQTIVPDQWPAFIAMVKSELTRHGQKVLPYLLVDT